MTCWLVALAVTSFPDTGLRAEPAEALLWGSDGRAQLLVTEHHADGTESDATLRAEYHSDRPEVVAVAPDGSLIARGDGKAMIRIRLGDRIAETTATVIDYADRRPVHFGADVVPILTRGGCNGGGCHGKSGGQGEFRLSLLGFDPAADHAAIVREAAGRRVSTGDPRRSLLVRKATGDLPHGGGPRLAPNSPEAHTLARWVAAGAPFAPAVEPKLVGLAVSPSRRVVGAGQTQSLRVEARYDDGTLRDVTRLAQYQSNAEDVAAVETSGRVQALESVGEAAIMARFHGQVAVARVTVPNPRPAPAWSDPPRDNLIDRHIFAKLHALGLDPSPPATEAEFARRSSLDLCGVLPDPAEVARFVADPRASKWDRWVDRLLARPEYADLFAMKWSAILRNRRDRAASQEGSFAFHAWIRHAIASNRPYDQFAAAIVGARGDLRSNPPVAWYRQVDSLDERVDDTAQLFLGIRMQCARCHHHPFERWGQDDYYGFASLFSRLRNKGDGNEPRIGLERSGLARNPTTKRDVPPTPLGDPPRSDLGPYDDPRSVLLEWMRRPDNPYFAPTVINRYWKHFFGRGLVEPEDDFRVTNPPTHPELLDELTRDFVSNGYDLRRLVRQIVTSETYRRSSLPTATNAADRQNYARYYPKRMGAEVLLDAMVRVTEQPEAFRDGNQVALPAGTRAVQVPDDGFASRFLDAFGRPRRASVCECERVAEANLAQTLLMLNSKDVQGKVAGAGGRAQRFADADPATDADRVVALYAVAFGRTPDADELATCRAHLDRGRAAGHVREAWEDVIWALLNTKEFQFIH